VALSVTAVIVAATYRSTVHYAETNELVRHTYEVKLQAENVLRLLDDAETGQRGYLLGGESRYLEPYRAALVQIEGTLNRLIDLTKDSPTQHANALEIRRLADGMLAELRQAIDLYESGKEEQAREIVLSGIGKQQMDEIRQATDRAKAEEDRLLAIRMAGANRERWIVVSSALALLPISFAIYLVFLHLTRAALSEQQRAKDAEQQLLKAHESLEHTVQERTRELHATEAKFRGLLEAAPDAVVVMDGEGKIVLVNTQTEKLFRYQREELLGHSKFCLPEMRTSRGSTQAAASRVTLALPQCTGTLCGRLRNLIGKCCGAYIRSRSNASASVSLPRSTASRAMARRVTMRATSKSSGLSNNVIGR
jgi:CHASE3 domain sensor protein